MKIFNTLTRQIEEFKPISSPEVKFYACGPTVYDFAHIGHLRKYTMDDILLKVLEKDGYQVKFVQNVTDVGHLASDADTGEDKLEKGAKKYKQDVWAIAQKFEDYFYRSMELMGNRKPDISCKATEHIDQMRKMVERLEEKGYTYVIEGDGVYYDSSKFPDYSKLANLNLEEMMEGARVEKVEGKRNPTDFALWKFERPGENRAMVWLSKWHPRSFPGWHIECSAMSMEYLGEQLDIHTGGIDHIPVHHTNEIAQSEAVTGKKPFSRYWVHHNFLVVDGEKMSKSKENFYTIDDVLKKGFEPMALRLLFLGAHYRSELNFTWKSLQGAQKAWERLKKMISSISISSKKDFDQNDLSVEGRRYYRQFFTKINDDLNTPEALAIFWQVTKNETISLEEKQFLLFEFDSIFGLGLSDIDFGSAEKNLLKKDLPTNVQQLLDQRAGARRDRDFTLADNLRNELAIRGYRVVDKEDEQLVFMGKLSIN